MIQRQGDIVEEALGLLVEIRDLVARDMATWRRTRLPLERVYLVQVTANLAELLSDIMVETKRETGSAVAVGTGSLPESEVGLPPRLWPLITRTRDLHHRFVAGREIIRAA